MASKIQLLKKVRKTFFVGKAGSLHNLREKIGRKPTYWEKWRRVKEVFKK